MRQGGGKRRGVIARFVVCRRSHRTDVESQYLVTSPGLKRLAVMDDLLELDEQILAFDISDEVIERAASAEQTAYTWAYCTNGAYWYDCNWPQ